MNGKLQELVRRAIEEVKEAKASDIAIKKSLIGFADSYNSTPAGKERICYDTEVQRFLEELFGRDSDSFNIYWKDYESAKKGEISIEPLPNESIEN